MKRIRGSKDFAILLISSISGAINAQISAGRLDLKGNDGIMIWLKITLDQQYCVTNTSHKWGTDKENIYTCKKDAACTCKGTVCEKSSVKVSKEWGVPDNGTMTDCQSGNSVMLRVSMDNFAEDVDHEISILAKSGEISRCV